MQPYIDIKIDGKYYLQRTPVSKIIEIDESKKTNTFFNKYSELPKEVQIEINAQLDIKANPIKYFKLCSAPDGKLVLNIKKPLDVQNLCIPETVLDEPVSAISQVGLPNTVTRIVLPDTIEYLFPDSFAHFTSLEEVVLSKNITKLPSCCFRGCTNLKKINTKNLTYIGNSAFKHCFLLEKINSENIDFIGECAFETSGLKEINLPKIKDISNTAFYNCKKLNNVTLGSDIKVIAACTFADNSNLKSVKITGNITEIHDRAFEGCSNLEEFDFGDELIQIGYRAFADTKLSGDIILPKSLSSIRQYAFWECHIDTVVIPDKCNVNSTSFKPFTKVTRSGNIVEHER